MQVILKLWEVSSSKINISKSQALQAGSYKKELIKQDKCHGHNFPLKYLGYILIILFLITPIGTKSWLSQKNEYLELIATLF